ncbi:putative membrane protein [Leptotrichia sp. oral taxon 215 str. W9775]|jgi:transporter|uniref:DMT family transporter n=1 Tax=Leptotrichia sp. oral taxon 215 TaxID=712359 RepID=UPI0003AD9160|nr:DMT family transporter [Leptotrichia sp. oral taxon 215]ERK67711.1 putative membrane protein [Leptotrichia sp. oral taxon 215 str. W9775]
MKKLVKRYIAESGLLLIGILWGMGFVTVKIGLNAGMNTFYLMWLRFLGSFVLLSILFRKKIKKVSKDDLKAGVILGIIQYFGYVFQTYGAAHTTVGKNAFFTAINVIIVPYIFWMLNKKRPDIFSFSASIICLIGVGIMSLDSNLNFTHLNKGDVMTIISAFFFALQVAYTGYFGRKVHPMNLVLLQMLVGGLLFAGTQFATSGLREVIPLHGETLMAIIYAVVFSTAIPMLLQIYCQRLTTATRASILMSTESMFAPIFAFLVLGEMMTLRVALGAVFILFSVVVSETKLGMVKEANL